MEFTKEVSQAFLKAWKEKKIVTINGVNYLGERFTTQGRISTSINGRMAGSRELGYIFIEYDNLVRKNGQQSKLNVLYAIDNDDFYSPDVGLFIVNIKVDGQIIFQNKKSEIYKIIKNGNQIKTFLKGQIGDDLPNNPVVNKLKGMIGQPVEFGNDEYGVFVGFDGSNKFFTCATMAFNNEKYTKYITKSTQLFGVNENGERVCIASNRKRTLHKLFEEDQHKDDLEY